MPLSLLKHLGGVTLTSHLLNGGHSKETLRRAAAKGWITRPRRGWVALAGADADLVMAAKYGVLLGCITQAKRLGLWIMEGDTRAHVAARHPKSRSEWPDARVHWCEPFVPRRADQLEDAIENVLRQVMSCQKREAALTILDSALNKKLTTLSALGKLPLRQVERALLADASPFADSGIETLVRTRISWLKVSIRTQVMIQGHRVDLLIGERLIVQIDGGHHIGRQRDSDIFHDARLLHEGYHVIRVSYVQIMYRWEEVHELIVGAVARGLHKAQ